LIDYLSLWHRFEIMESTHGDVDPSCYIFSWTANMHACTGAEQFSCISTKHHPTMLFLNQQSSGKHTEHGGRMPSVVKARMREWLSISPSSHGLLTENTGPRGRYLSYLDSYESNFPMRNLRLGVFLGPYLNFIYHKMRLRLFGLIAI
jgi:hypothetical protein